MSCHDNDSKPTPEAPGLAPDNAGHGSNDASSGACSDRKPSQVPLTSGGGCCLIYIIFFTLVMMGGGFMVMQRQRWQQADTMRRQRQQIPNVTHRKIYPPPQHPIPALDKLPLRQSVTDPSSGVDTSKPPEMPGWTWREYLDRANREMVGVRKQENENLRFPRYGNKIWPDYERGVRLLHARNDIQSNAEDATRVANAFYGCACICAVASRHMDTQEDKTRYYNIVFAHLDVSIRSGLFLIKCTCHEDGRKHMEADPDLREHKKDPRFAELLKHGQ